MLDAFIIEELRRREEAEQRKSERERPRLELPLHNPDGFRGDPGYGQSQKKDETEKSDRGVIVIDF